jgi:hypothetical protein
MSKSAGALSVLLLSGGIFLSGCGAGNPPCEQLNVSDPVTPEMRASTLQGAEVEIEVEVDSAFGETTAECVAVVTGETAKWQDQTDDA